MIEYKMNYKVLMKRKSILSISALLLGATMFASCTPANTKISFRDYWYSDADIPTSTGTEVLTYDVTFEAGNGLSDKNFDVNYSNGVYTTSFQKVTENEKEVYLLHSSLTIDVTYTYAGESVTLTDTVESNVYFEKNVSFTPIKSSKEIKNHSPRRSAYSLDTAYATVHYTVDVTYNGARGIAKVDDLTDEKPVSEHNFTLDDADEYNYLDNEQLLFALRGVNATQTNTPTFLVYSPFSKTAQKIQANYGAKVSGEKFKFKKDGEETPSDKTLDYYNVTLALQGKNPGTPQMIKIATHANSKNNPFRNVILEMEVPLSYNLGVLTYTLNSAQFF